MPRSTGAVKVGGWTAKHAGLYADWPGVAALPASPPTLPFPQAPLDISVKILVDNSWIDITHFVYHRVDIELTRGRPNEAGKVDPSTATFQINNRDGQFSPRNPLSWLYGRIGRNTQVRAAIGADIRFSGEISEWPPRWDVTGTDIYVPIQAAGILRRLTQGATPLKSTMYRALTTLQPAPKAYWPCEDGDGAASIASAVGGSAMQVSGTKAFAQFTEFACSDALPLATGAEWNGVVPSYAFQLDEQVLFLMRTPTAGGAATAGQQIIRVYQVGGSIALWELIYEAGGNLRLRATDITGAAALDSGLGSFAVNNKLLRVSLEFHQVFATQIVTWRVSTLEVGQSTGVTFTGNISPFQLGRCARVVINPGSDLGDLAIGHVSVHDQIRDLFTLSSELGAYAGERAGRRIKRLCTEEAVSLRIVGAPDATAALGPQRPATLVTLLQDAADADGGILYEPRDVFGLGYRTQESMYNQPAALALDNNAAPLSSIEPTDDDQLLRNDVTVTRTGGSSYRTIKETGALSILAPPAGVGRYDTDITLNVASDRDLPDRAGWLLYLGTVDEARYPILSFDLARQVFTANPALAGTVRTLDIGDRLTVANPPAWLPPDQISQLAQGFTETMGNFTHRIAVNCAPETPWSQIARWSDGTARYTSNATTLSADVDTVATSLTVAVAGPIWSHDDGDFTIKVGGETMTVTAVSGASSPQTFTVVRSVNGVVKAHVSGEAVELAPPRVYVP